ncbi:MAG TPA: chromate transporter [Chitinivibrionales bacterium]|nr:chromate transporter [Chitinivibrionales bacterium]
MPILPQPARSLDLNVKKYVEVLAVSLKLGLTSFGGPIAHIGYFHEEYVRRKKWLDEGAFADLVALCQFLPGPASSQLGVSIGVLRAGSPGGLIAWLGFTLPSAVALFFFAYFLRGADIGSLGWIHGLKIVAVAIVAQAIISMGQRLAPDRKRVSIAIAAMTIVLLWRAAIGQVAVIAASGIVGLFICKNSTDSRLIHAELRVSRKFGAACLILFFALLTLLPIFRHLTSNHWVAIADSFYRSGSLVFGGGHVVLPLLAKEVVPTGWISNEHFLTGYAAAQAVPGPLFTFASYLGAMMNGTRGAILATLSIFLPGILLIMGALPFWNWLRRSLALQAALTGINAAVVGVLLAALYNPIWISAIISPIDFTLAAILFVMLVFWKLPPWMIVVAGAIGGTLVSHLI